MNVFASSGLLARTFSFSGVSMNPGPIRVDAHAVLAELGVRTCTNDWIEPMLISSQYLATVVAVAEGPPSLDGPR
jgi:hypothetical protein